ncbi:hypothetical protein Tco_1146610 [Tanacetum coccineum]
MPVQTRRHLATDPEMCMFAASQQSEKRGMIFEVNHLLQLLAGSCSYFRSPTRATQVHFESIRWTSKNAFLNVQLKEGGLRLLTPDKGSLIQNIQKTSTFYELLYGLKHAPRACVR